MNDVHPYEPWKSWQVEIQLTEAAREWSIARLEHRVDQEIRAAASHLKHRAMTDLWTDRLGLDVAEVEGAARQVAAEYYPKESVAAVRLLAQAMPEYRWEAVRRLSEGHEVLAGAMLPEKPLPPCQPKEGKGDGDG
jgi:hypothetical protein